MFVKNISTLLREAYFTNVRKAKRKITLSNFNLSYGKTINNVILLFIGIKYTDLGVFISFFTSVF